MSETHYVRCTRVGSNEVCRSSDGWAEIEPMHQGRSMGERITIMREDVPAVALALLGGRTPELIRRCTLAICVQDGWAWRDYELIARDVLTELFGIEDVA